MLKLIRKFKDMSPSQKARLTSGVTMTVNFVMAGAKIFFGIFSAFWFICVSGAYSLCVGLCKRIYFVGRARSDGETFREIKYYRAIGVVLMLAAVCYIGYMIQYVMFPSDLRRYGAITSIVIVAVSVCEVIFAIIGVVRARKDKDLLMEGLKFVNLVSSTVAVVTAEAVTLVFLSDIGLAGSVNAALVNAVFGLFLGVVSLGIGIYLFVKSHNVKRRFCGLYPEQCGDAESKDETSE